MSVALRLITIPISHYCEKARWALDRAGLPFVEDAHLQVFHYWPVWRAGGGRTVPVLVHPGGVVRDSGDILRWADQQAPTGRKLFPGGPAQRAEIERLAERLDADLGPAGRLWMYHHILNEAPELGPKYACTGVPGWQRRLLPLAFPLVKRYLERRLKTGPLEAIAARDQFRRVLDQVAERLATGSGYLVGDCFSAADLTFAALCAPVLMTPGYGVPLPLPEELPPSVATEVAACRAHPAGRFALDLYQCHRRP